MSKLKSILVVYDKCWFKTCLLNLVFAGKMFLFAGVRLKKYVTVIKQTSCQLADKCQNMQKLR
jgi:hypothetical protein